MVVKHSANLLLSKFSLVYKLMLYCAIVVAIFTGIGIGVIVPLTRPLVNGIVGTGFFEHLSETVSLFFQGDVNYSTALQNLNNDITAIGAVIQNNYGALTGSIILIVVFFVLAGMFIGLADIPTVDILNNFMTSKSRYGFSSNFIDNIKLSVKYNLVKVLVTLVFDVGILALAVYLTTLIFSVNSLFALFLFVFMVVGISAVRQSFTSLWLPAIVADNGKIFASLKYSIVTTTKRFAKFFGTYFIVYLIIASIGILFTLSTFGVGFVFMVPGSMLFTRCLEMVFYYTLNGKSFYTSVDKIVKPDVVELKSFEDNFDIKKVHENPEQYSKLPVLYNQDKTALADTKSKELTVVKDKNKGKTSDDANRKKKKKNRLTNIPEGKHEDIFKN